LFTPWEITGLALFSAVLALVSAAVVLLMVVFRKRLTPGVLIFGGVLYFLYAVMIVLSMRGN